LSYLLSNQPGLGTQLLEDAYKAAKQLQPDRRVRLNAIPGSEEFYRKQRQYGWNEGVQEGMPVFIRKAQGGLAQVKDR
jgi:predicted GNAT family N-acyltransferase